MLHKCERDLKKISMCLHKIIIFCKVDVILIRMVTISIINNVKNENHTMHTTKIPFT